MLLSTYKELSFIVLFRVNARDVDRACAEERAIRLGEIAEEIQNGGLDSLKEALKDAMLMVQEQMLLSVFRGHKVMDQTIKQVSTSMSSAFISHNHHK